MIDAHNKISHHIVIAFFSTIIVIVMVLAGFRVSRAIAAMSFFLLFLVMVIGPVRVVFSSLKKRLPPKFPWNWRAELGIWFTIWSVIHILYVFNARDWDILGYIIDMSPWAFGAFVAVIMAIFLSAISCQKALEYIGVEAWKWIQSYFSYVIFWLTTVHVVDRALLRPGFPSADWIHWLYLAMIDLLIILQMAGFLKKVKEYRKELNEN